MYAFVQIGVILLFLVVEEVVTAKVYLLFPHGFSVHVDHEPDIVNVHFYVNVTKNQEPTLCFKKRVSHISGNQWIFKRRHLKFEAGDIITYKTIVNKKRTREREENGSCDVTETPRRQKWASSNDILLNCNLHIDASLLALDFELEHLRNLTRLLERVEEVYPVEKELTLSGRIPPDGDPEIVVDFILREKLNVKPAIKSAFRESTYCIKFTVKSIDEKSRILEAAKHQLKSTSIVIE